MRLRHKLDGTIYNVRTESDYHDGFFIFAYNQDPSTPDFCMHYRSLQEFTDDWEDVD